MPHELHDTLGVYTITPQWVARAVPQPRALQLYTLLGLYRNNQTGAAFPSRKTLAAEMGCSESSITRGIKILVAAGALRVETRNTRNGRTSNLYYIVRDIPDSIAQVSPVTFGLEAQVSPMQLGVAQVSPVTRPSVTRVGEPDQSNQKEEEKKSSSSSSESVEFGNHFFEEVRTFYSSLASQRDPGSPGQKFLSPIKAPGPYFRELQRNGDTLPRCDLEACRRFVEEVWSAQTYGGQFPQTLLLPRPAVLPGLASCAAALDRYSLDAHRLRIALGVILEKPGERPAASEILVAIAGQPELFFEALHQASKVEYTAVSN